MGRNSYFKFKQFTIEQKNAAMKVGTDGVLLGAWTSVENVHSILDIGTGTGLLALMLAQRCDAYITGIDCEETACCDASANVLNSMWKNRVTIINLSFQDYLTTCNQKFDCIICNPPYFSNSLKPTDNQRLVARHNDNLSFSVLLSGVSEILNKDGHFSVVLPYAAEQEFRMIAANYRLFPSRILRVKPKPSGIVSRVLIEFRFEADPVVSEELTIETENHHEYQPEYIELVKDFYLFTNYTSDMHLLRINSTYQGKR